MADDPAALAQLAHDAARSHEQSQRDIFDTKTCLACSEAAALAACLRCFLGSLSALRLRGFLSLAPAVLAMTGADSCTKSRSNGREKAVKQEPKASRDSGESHQKPHQKLHQHRPKVKPRVQYCTSRSRSRSFANKGVLLRTGVLGQAAGKSSHGLIHSHHHVNFIKTLHLKLAECNAYRAHRHG